MAHLDAVAKAEGAVAVGAEVPRLGQGDVGHDVGLPVATVVDVEEVSVRLVGPGHQVLFPRDQVVGQHLHSLEAHSGGRAGDEAGSDDLLLAHVVEVQGAQGPLELHLVDLHVAADGHEDGGAIGGVEDGLAGLGRGYPQVIGQGLDGVYARRGDLLNGLGILGVGAGGQLLEGGHGGVGGVAAALAQEAGVLAEFREVDELVGVAAAHGAGVGQDGQRGQAATVEDVLVGAVHLLVGDVQPLPVGIQAVEVLHGELAQADEAATGPWLVAELLLDLVDH